MFFDLLDIFICFLSIQTLSTAPPYWSAEEIERNSF